MLRLDLTAEPRWLDLGHGVRLRAAPLTTALMVASRSDRRRRGAARHRLRRGAGAGLRQGDRPARGDRVGGRRRRRRQPGAGHARGHRRAARGLADLRGVPGGLRLEGPAAGCGKKRLRALADWHFGGGDRYCAACGASVPGLPGAAEPAGDLRRLAGLGPGRPPRRPAPGDPRRGDRLGHGRGAGARPPRSASRRWPPPSCCRRSRR